VPFSRNCASFRAALTDASRHPRGFTLFSSVKPDLAPFLTAILDNDSPNLPALPSFSGLPEQGTLYHRLAPHKAQLA